MLDDGNPPPCVVATLAVKPWWMRFFKAIELAIFGSVVVEGKIVDLRESDRVGDRHK